MTQSFIPFTVLFLVTGTVFAEVPVPGPPDNPVPEFLTGTWTDSGQTLNSVPGPCLWGNAEFLLWWVKGDRLPPLATIGDPYDPVSVGALGRPGTQVIYGGDTQGFGSFSGGRLTLGGWLDTDHTFGLEGSGFLLEHRSALFSVASDANGAPAFNVPVFLTDLGREGSFLISTPNVGNGAFLGNLNIASTTGLWGTEINSYVNILRNERWTVDVLTGFRYLDLQESLQLEGTIYDVAFDILTNVNDRFNTRNQFYGAQLGTRLQYQWQSLSFDVIGKVALGGNHEVVGIAGFGSQSGTGVPGPVTFPGGIFTQPFQYWPPIPGPVQCRAPGAIQHGLESHFQTAGHRGLRLPVLEPGGTTGRPD